MMKTKLINRLSAGRCLRSVFLFAALGAAGCSAVAAELRVWTSQNGKQLEATFERLSFDSVKVRTPAGVPISLELNRLSDMDVKYLRTVVEPEIAVKVKKKKKSVPRNSAFMHEDDNGYEAVTLTVDIRKTSKFPYDGTLRAEAVMLGEEVNYSDLYRVVAKNVFPVTLPEDNGGQCEFSFEGRFRTYVEYTGAETRGIEYGGYLIVLSDARGKVVHVETDLAWLNTPEKVDRLRTFRYFTFLNQECKKRSVPQPKRVAQ